MANFDSGIAEISQKAFASKEPGTNLQTRQEILKWNGSLSNWEFYHCKSDPTCFILNV